MEFLVTRALRFNEAYTTKNPIYYYEQTIAHFPLKNSYKTTAYLITSTIVLCVIKKYFCKVNLNCLLKQTIRYISHLQPASYHFSRLVPGV